MDAGLTFRLRKRTVAVLLLIAAGLAMVISRPGKPGELAVYMKAAERILHGEQIYRTDDTAAFTYPPFFVLPTVPLAHASLARARVWWFFNLCLAGVILFLIARLIWPVVANNSGENYFGANDQGIGSAPFVAFRSAKAACFRGAKGNYSSTTAADAGCWRSRSWSWPAGYF